MNVALEASSACRIHVHCSGPKQVFFAGHSRGGLLPFAHLARFPEAPFKALVSLGSPFTFAHQPGVQRFVELV
ncbi:MAG: hypothetical protein MUF13_14530, partial [Akkermansiaceae bacterium]|nr:hypothetical protein [Akkermansiaceae bacterium]